MSLLLALHDLNKHSLPLVGGKAANLGELLRAGLPVPPGFVLTTDAYSLFVTTHNVQGDVERLAHAVNPDDNDALEAASHAIGVLFTKHAIPDAITSAVRDAYRALGSPPVAVRSSATAEDLADASFAGQMESYLNVRGEDALLRAVRRCWASLWTPRAISYRARQGIPPSAVKLAVVVQQLLDADAAGVLFTANPVTGHRGQMVVDATWGLGEALVSGQVTPDHWVLDTNSGTVLETRLAHKLMRTERTAEGTALSPLPPELQDRPVLDEPALRDLIDLGRRVAAHFGPPQDVEWARVQGQLYLVQSRPITSLFPVPTPAPDPKAGLRVYVCGNVLQGIVEPLTPMGIALFRCLINAIAEFKYRLKVPRGQAAPVFKVAAGRIYADATTPLRSAKSRRVFPKAAGVIDHHIVAIIAALLEREPRLSPINKPLPIHLPTSFVVGLLGKIVAVVWSPEKTPLRLLAATERMARRLELMTDKMDGLTACRDFMELNLVTWWPQVMYNAAPLAFPAIGMRFVAEALVKRWLGEATPLQPVLRSFPHNPTMEMDLALWGISRQLKAEGVEPTAEHPAVVAFLAKYGHRAVREIDVGMPRWREEPEHVLNVLRTYLTHGEEADPDRQFQAGAVAAEEASKALVDRVRREKGWWRARVLAFVLRRVRALGGWREYPKFLAVRIFAAIRKALRRAGAALVAEGKLDRAEDVFFLDPTDFDAADLRAIVAKNRADYDRELKRKVIPRVMTSEGETFYTAPNTVPGALVGTPASPGCYEGRVRVIRDPRGAKLEPGEVLVAPGTDPAWTPLFLTAGALVMELGGIMSHGSVVAREYGIPAVVGVPGATEQLRTGQRVRVDGESGQVVPL